jgi:tetratricopeptide (TPR) repeat protein
MYHSITCKFLIIVLFYRLAIHLYLRALTLNGMHSCQSAVLMNNLAESYASMGRFDEAKLWGQRGLDLAQNPNTAKVNKDREICDETCGVLLFNMGMLFEVI